MISPITIQPSQVRFGERVRTRLNDNDFQQMKVIAGGASVTGTASAGAGLAAAGAGPAGATASLPLGASIGANLITGTAGSGTQMAGTGLMATGPQSGLTAFLFRALDHVGLDKFADWLAEQPILGGAALMVTGSTVNSIGGSGGGTGAGLAVPH